MFNDLYLCLWTQLVFDWTLDAIDDSEEGFDERSSKLRLKLQLVGISLIIYLDRHLASRYQEMHARSQIWVEGLLALEADVTEANDGNRLHFDVEIIASQNLLYQLHASVQVRNKFLLQIGCQVLKNSCGNSLAECIETHFAIGDGLLDELENGVRNLLNFFNGQSIDQAIHYQQGAASISRASIADRHQDFVDVTLQAIFIQAWADVHDENLKQSTEVIDECF
jgi:hypothetical protein